MAFDEYEAATVKGLLHSGKYRQCDIAAYYGVNSARIAEINTGVKYPHIRPAPADHLPNLDIPKKKTPAKKAVIRVKDHCTHRERAVNGMVDGLYRNFEGFETSIQRIEKRFHPLSKEDKESLIKALQQISLQYQLLSQKIEI